jgi:hypothetical protein
MLAAADRPRKRLVELMQTLVPTTPEAQNTTDENKTDEKKTGSGWAGGRGSRTPHDAGGSGGGGGGGSVSGVDGASHASDPSATTDPARQIRILLQCNPQRFEAGADGQLVSILVQRTELVGEPGPGQRAKARKRGRLF